MKTILIITALILTGCGTTYKFEVEAIDGKPKFSISAKGK